MTIVLGIAGFILTTLVCVAVYRMEYQSAQKHFEREMDLQVLMLGSEVSVLEKALMSMREGRTLAADYSHEAFSFMTEAHLLRQPLLEGVVWVGAGNDGVLYKKFREGAKDFDNGIALRSRGAITHALENQVSVMTGYSGQSGLLIVLPWQSSLYRVSDQQGEGAFLALFELRPLLNRVFSGLDKGACYRLLDMPQHDAAYSTETHVLAQNCLPGGVIFQRDFEMPGERHWRLIMSPHWNFLTVSFLPWVTASAGLLMIIVVCGFLSMLQHYSRKTSRLVNERTAELRAANRRLESLSLTDPLTDLSNRRAFDEYLSHEWQRALREKTPVTLILLDVDYFKRLNDTYGHPAGDAVLEQLARLMEDAFKRPADMLARFGGEEFAIVLPNTTLSVVGLAEKLRIMVASTPFEIPGETRLTITVSLGMASVVPTAKQGYRDLLKAADEALYAAKASGRNRLVIKE